ncbi:MAG: hypothetical protein LKF36_15400 [Lactobacillus sp.]|jgi:hypothetical protein|nr:hypothetical protein [Lactobacillus sp.]
MHKNAEHPKKHTKLRRFILFAGLFSIVLLSLNIYRQHNYLVKTEPTTFSGGHVENTRLIKDYQRVLKNSNSQAAVQVAVYSKQTNKFYNFSNQKQPTFYTASIVKISILTQLLHNHQENNTDLSSEERSLAKASIEKSSNKASTDLYVYNLGGAQELDNLFNNLNMNNSAASNIGWTVTTTTAEDQVKLLNNIFYPSEYLSTRSQNYIKNLMENVARSQQWGISAGGTPFQNKNGWEQKEDGTWVINSMGHIGTGNKSITIAVLTAQNKTKKDGIKLVESLAKAASKELK